MPENPPFLWTGEKLHQSIGIGSGENLLLSGENYYQNTTCHPKGNSERQTPKVYPKVSPAYRRGYFNPGCQLSEVWTTSLPWQEMFLGTA